MARTNPRPKLYASAAERQAAYRERFATIEVRLDPTTVDTLTRIAQALDVPRAELIAQVIKHGLLNRNWGVEGLRSDLKSKTVQQQGARVTPKKRAAKQEARVIPKERKIKTLQELLFEAPENAVLLVQEAIRLVAKGDWKGASRQMSMAAEVSESEDQWFIDAGAAADDLMKRAR